MRTPSNPAIRRAAKGAVMAGTAALTVIAVGSLVKRRVNPPEAASPYPDPARDPAPREDAE
jgi:hypothetical protein